MSDLLRVSNVKVCYYCKHQRDLLYVESKNIQVCSCCFEKSTRQLHFVNPAFTITVPDRFGSNGKRKVTYEESYSDIFPCFCRYCSHFEYGLTVSENKNKDKCRNYATLIQLGKLAIDEDRVQFQTDSHLYTNCRKCNCELIFKQNASQKDSVFCDDCKDNTDSKPHTMKCLEYQMMKCKQCKKVVAHRWDRSCCEKCYYYEIRLKNKTQSLINADIEKQTEELYLIELRNNIEQKKQSILYQSSNICCCCNLVSTSVVDYYNVKVCKSCRTKFEKISLQIQTAIDTATTTATGTSSKSNMYYEIDEDSSVTCQIQQEQGATNVEDSSTKYKQCCNCVDWQDSSNLCNHDGKFYCSSCFDEIINKVVNLCTCIVCNFKVASKGGLQICSLCNSLMMKYHNDRMNGKFGLHKIFQ